MSSSLDRDTPISVVNYTLRYSVHRMTDILFGSVIRIHTNDCCFTPHHALTRIPAQIYILCRYVPALNVNQTGNEWLRSRVDGIVIIMISEYVY